MVNWSEEIKKWLTSGTDTKEDMMDLVWNVKDQKTYLVAENPKIPFILYIFISEKFIRIQISTGLKTALLDPIQRLDIYRKLLLLNDKIDMPKFVIEGTDEEIVLKVDLDIGSLNKNEFSDALMGALTSLYMMIKEFQLEEEFNKRLTERIVGMIQEKLNEGATREEIKDFLMKKVGLDQKTAENLINDITNQAEYLPEYQ
ncbi:MAG: YbjN domain-containing protein [Thermoplasmata archaeon]